jgi:hypothetical protein
MRAHRQPQDENRSSKAVSALHRRDEIKKS